MKESEYKISGYSFSDSREYKEAKREAETIDYIRANTDLRDSNKVLKLYHKLVERKTLKTIVGFEFLKELQDKILKEGIVSKENLPYIQIEKDSKQYQVYTNPLAHDKESKNNNLATEYRIRHRNSRIINVFLAIVIIIMFIITLLSDRNIFKNYEEEVIDKYAAWEEELTAWEEELTGWEKILRKHEEAILQE